MDYKEYAKPVDNGIDRLRTEEFFKLKSLVKSLVESRRCGLWAATLNIDYHVGDKAIRILR